MTQVRGVTITLRDRQVTGGSIPGDALFGEPFVNLWDGVLRFSGVTGGGYETSSQTGVFEVGSTLYNQKITNRLNINDNFIISGDTGLISTYNGTSGSGLTGKFLSGTTTGFVIANITDIAASTDTYITGATWSPNTLSIKPNLGKPNILVTIDTFTAATFGSISVTGNSVLNTLYATAASGGTLYSGSTNLGSLFVNGVVAGSNVSVGGSSTFPIINIVANPSFGSITASGASSFTTLSATTLYSGSTNLYSIFAPYGTVSGVNSVGGVGNIITGGTALDPTIAITASPSFNNITYSGISTGGNSIASSVSATTFYSAGTNLGNVINSSITAITSLLTSTRVQNGTNTVTGGTPDLPTVNVVSSPSFDNILFSGTATGGNIYGTNVSGGTLYSGNTNLYSIFSVLGSGVQSVGANGNLSTGGTATNPTIVLSQSPSFNNLTFSGTATGGNVYGTNVSGGTLYSGNTNLNGLFVNGVVAGSNVSVGGSSTFPTVGVIESPTFTGLVTASGFTDTALTAGRVTFAGTGGKLTDVTGFTYDTSVSTLNAPHIVVGSPGQSGTSATIYGDVLVIGQAISGFTSQLYIEDNNITLNYNPTGGTSATSLGAGFAIQDGDGVTTDALFDVRGAATGVANRSFSTNLNDIRVRETGTVSAPNGVRLIAETDVLDGGSY